LVLVKTGEQGSPRRTTTSRVIELGEPESVLGKRVEVRGKDFPSIASDVGVPHVIRQNEHDVRFTLGKKGKEEGKEGDNQAYHKQGAVFSMKF
jgi:hypothetical protein